MTFYTYHIQAGELSEDFTAPLLGKKGSKVTIYGTIDDEVFELMEITIHEIDTESKTVECTSNVR